MGSEMCIRDRYRTGGHFRSAKNHPEMGQAPTSQAIPRDTDHLRPSNLATRTLSLVEHTHSKFGGDPCSVRRGLAAAVKCYVRKARFSASVEQNERILSLVWVSTPQRDNLFCFLFSGTIIVDLTTDGNARGFQYNEWITCFVFCFLER